MGLFSNIRKAYQEHRRKMKSVTTNQVIAIALENQGKITKAVLSTRTQLSVRQAGMKLQGLHNQGVFSVKYTMKDNSYTYVLKKPELYQNIDLGSLPPETPYTQTKKLTDAEVIQLALKGKGRITAAILCIKAEVSIDQAKEKLQSLQHKGVFDIEVANSGALVYVLNELETFKELM